jgi:outer membrane translocation and assembly module TamA
MLPFFNNAPLAIDFAYPLTRASGDDTFYLSFSLGVAP